MEANKYTPFPYINSIPMGLGIIECYESRKGNIKGEAKGFRFYCEEFLTVNARFNINDLSLRYDEFFLKIETMFSVLRYLNKRPTGAYHVKLILEHINENCRHKFSVRKVFLKIRKSNYIHAPIAIKRKDYIALTFGNYEKGIDYLNALNGARKTVNTYHNLKELFYLLEERITNEDYGYMNEAIVTGHKDNNLLIYAMIQKFNLLCTGRQRKQRKQSKNEPLYNSSIKSITQKSMSLKSQQQNAFVQKKILMFERELKELNQLVNNRSIALQMFLILKELTGLNTDIELISDDEVQNQLKTELMNLINRTSNMDFLTGAKEFNDIFKKCLKKELPIITNLDDIFDVDLTNSIFNQVTIEEAYSRGAVFWKEFNNFHNVTVENGTMNFGIALPD